MRDFDEMVLVREMECRPFDVCGQYILHRINRASPGFFDLLPDTDGHLMTPHPE
jgi:hypothetical protein